MSKQNEPCVVLSRHRSWLRCALAVAMTLACGCDRSSPEATQHVVDGEPDAPFDLWSSHRGAIGSGGSYEVTVHVRTARSESALSSELRGVDGVRVSAGGRFDHGTTRRGQVVRHTATVLVDKGVAGYLAVDVSWLQDGAIQSTTYAIGLHADGARYRSPSLGRIEPGVGGERIEVLPSASTARKTAHTRP